MVSNAFRQGRKIVGLGSTWSSRCCTKCCFRYWKKSRPLSDFAHLLDAHASAHPGMAAGLAVAHAGHDPQIWFAGPLRPGGAQPVAEDACWHIGSITKTFTATLAVLLSERGAVSLDAPIGPLLDGPDVHPDWQALTLRALLSHTSGLPPNTPVLAFLRPHRNRDPGEAAAVELTRLWHRPIKGKRGRFDYSNLGFVLAGHVLARATGRPWRGLVKTEICAPLRLSCLGLGPPCHPASPWGQRRLLWWHGSIDPAKPGSDNPPWLDAAGRLHMTLRDLTGWGQAYLDAGLGKRGAIISQDAACAMRHPGSGEAGIGWLVQRHEETGVTVVWHDGSNTMWRAILATVPDRGLVVALVQNRYEPAASDDLFKAVLTTALEQT